MAFIWSSFRSYVRKAILNDDPTDPQKRRWGDDLLLIYLAWAQNTLCAHTALPKSFEIENAVGDSFSLPDDIYDDARALEAYGQVSALIACAARPTYYNPLLRTKGAGPGATGSFFTVTPDGRLKLSQTIKSAATLTIRYFAYFPAPSGSEADVNNFPLQFPAWAQDPIAYLIGAHALAGLSMSAANIKMWAEAPEKGSPESNPYRAQQKWFVDMYERAIARVDRQDRMNYYRYDR